MEMDDLLKMKMLGEKDSLTPYEQFKVQNMQTKSHTSGLGIAGLTVGVGAAILAVGGAAWAGSRASNAKDVAIAKNDGLRDLLISNTNNTNATIDRITRTLERETDARVNGDLNISQNITDTISGQQSSALTATQQAELAASQVATQQVMTGLMTGRYSENPQRVALYRDASPCPCPAGGCGCGYNG